MKRRSNRNRVRGGSLQHKHAHPLHNTPSTNTKVTSVTVTRPHHPLAGHAFELISAGRHWLTVRSPDGSRRRIRPEWTNYDDLSADVVRPEPSYLFNTEGLRQLVSILSQEDER